MLIAHDISQIVPYRLKSDTEGEPTIFQLGYFDTLLRAHLESKYLRDDDKIDVSAPAFMVDCVRYGLRGWTNLQGAPQPDTLFEMVHIPGVGERRRMTDEGINVLRLEWAAELTGEIVRLNFLAKEAAKN